MKERPLYINKRKGADKRNNLYVFSNLRDLKKYFRQYMPAPEVEKIISTASQGFVTREGASRKETELQFIKKCEYIMVRKLRGA